MANEPTPISKHQIDELYHLLRVAHGSDKETRDSIIGLAYHILRKPDYVSLALYLDFYGSRYLLPEVQKFLGACGSTSASKIFDLGAGTGWVGASLARHYGTHAVLVDKRSLVLLKYSDEGNESLHVDLEAQDSVNYKHLLDIITGDDLVVMVDLLHCIDKPSELLEQLKDKAPILILEYVAHEHADWRKSYSSQLVDYGAHAFDGNQILSMVEGIYKEVAHGPHTNTKPSTHVKYQLVEPYIMIYAR